MERKTVDPLVSLELHSVVDHPKADGQLLGSLRRMHLEPLHPEEAH